MCDHGGHLHRVPSSTLLHDVSVKGVEDDLVRQLKRLIQIDAVLGCLYVVGVPRLLRLTELAAPNLDKALELVASISEVSDGIYVERVLSHADCVCAHLTMRLLHVVIVHAGEVSDASLQLLMIILTAFKD